MKFTVTLMSFLLPSLFVQAQSRLWQVPAVAHNIQLREDTAAVLAALVIDVPTDGKVFLKFDGNCISTPGDRIVFGASDYPNWRSNDGNTNIILFDSVHTLTCFAHSQVYDVTAGTHTYYAVAQNYVDLNGTGIASIDGRLTVLYVPDSSDTEVLHGSGIVDGPVQWESDVYTFEQIEITAPSSGKILVNFDGTWYMEYEEIALLTSSLSPDFPNHEEISRVELSAENEFGNFTHRKVYEVAAGTYQVYALVKKIQGDFDPFTDYLYATLSAHFIADATNDADIYNQYVNDKNVSDNGAERVAQITFDAPADGVVHLQFAGQSTSSLEDRINITLRDSDNPDDTLGLIALQPVLEINPQTFFSVSGIADVSAGSHTYNVMVDFDDTSGGTGSADISGLFTVHYVQDIISHVKEFDKQMLEAMIYPNPTTGILYGQILDTSNPAPGTLTIFDLSGEKLSQLSFDYQGVLREDIGDLPDGQYLVRIEYGEKVRVVKVMKMGQQ